MNELLMDLRERMVRIETKLDANADHGARLKAVEEEVAATRTSVRTFKWVGAGVMAVLTIFGDSLANMIH